MKTEIENLNLLYGVSIFNIISKNNNFNTPLNNITTISVRLNDFFIFLSKQKEINDFNILSVATLILSDEELYSYFINDNFNESKVNKIITDKIKKINFNELNNDNTLEFEYYYLNYNLDNQRIKNINMEDYIKDLIYKSNLLYADLIMLLINNWNFPKKIEKMQPDNWTIYFLNSLNLLFYELNKIIKVDRKNLYYISMIILKTPNIKSLLYPHSVSHQFNKNNVSNSIKHYIYDVILLALHNINQYYYIEYSDYYNNRRKHFYNRESKQKIEMINSILETFDVEHIIFLFKIANCSNKTIPLKNNQELKDLIKVINSNKDITIYSQNINENIENLIQDNYKFICEYCKKEKLKVIDCLFTMKNEQNGSTNFITVNIEYNNFIYNFVLSKYNQNYTWKIFLKNKKVYKINLCLPDDFKHLVQMMKLDSNNYYYNIIPKRNN